MPSLILHQIDQFTGGELFASRIEQARGDGVAGFEFFCRDTIADAQGLETALFRCLDEFAAAKAELPVLAVGVTCELASTEQFTDMLQPLIAGCGARGVKYLNFAILPLGAGRSDAVADAADLVCASLSYGEAAHLVYTGLRDLRHSIEAAGVMVTLEAGRHGLFLSPLEMRQMIDAINSWAVGACVGAQHVSSFSRPGDWVRTLGRRLLVMRGAANLLAEFGGVIVIS